MDKIISICEYLIFEKQSQKLFLLCRTTRGGWLGGTRPPASTPSAGAWPTGELWLADDRWMLSCDWSTGAPASGSRATWRSRATATWRTGDPPATATPTRWPQPSPLLATKRILYTSIIKIVFLDFKYVDVFCFIKKRESIRNHPFIDIFSHHNIKIKTQSSRTMNFCLNELNGMHFSSNARRKIRIYR